MAIGLASLEGMWCGQGMAHLLKLFHDQYANPETTAPDMMALFDFGTSGSGLSESKKVLGISPPVKTLVKTLELQVTAGKTPTLNLVVFSHQDADHWTLVTEFVEQVKKRKIPLVVTRIVYGGTGWGSGAKKAMESLAAYIPKQPVENKVPVALKASYSDYRNANGQLTTTATLDDVILRTIITNAPSTISSKNGTSAVMTVQLGGLSFILPGDATFQTLGVANGILEKWNATPLPSVYMMSAPHHGALATMTRKNERDASGLPELKKFIDLTKPYSAFASAGNYSSHKHPYLVILVAMQTYAGSHEFPDPHNVVVYEANNEYTGWSLIPDINRNVYTTVLNLEDPIETADWIYSVNSEGHFITTARFFQAGARAVEGVPQSNPTTVATDTDMLAEERPLTVTRERTRPRLLARDILPGIEAGYHVLPAGIFARRAAASPGRAWPARRLGTTAGPVPPNRRVPAIVTEDVQ